MCFGVQGFTSIGYIYPPGKAGGLKNCGKLSQIGACSAKNIR
jgi:hypothetical protein